MAQKRKLQATQAQINTRENLYYYKLRDDIVKIQSRISKVKQRETETQNEKMFSKLINILTKEKRALSKVKERQLGPVTLNMQFRKRTINAINKDNEMIS